MSLTATSNQWRQLTLSWLAELLKSEVECNLCLRDKRVFPLCIVVNLDEGHLSCANCHWENSHCSTTDIISTCLSTDSRRTNPCGSHQGCRDTNNISLTAITQDVQAVRAASNALKQERMSLQSRLNLNSTAWNELHTTTLTVISRVNEGRILRQGDTRELQRVANQVRAQGRNIQTAMRNVNSQTKEVDNLLTRMEEHMRNSSR